MTIAIGDLLVRYRSDTSDIQRGGEVAKQTLQSVAQQADVTSRALDIMAQQFAKLHGGTAAEALDIFKRSGAQPTATALAQAAREMENVAASATRAVTPTQSVAKAAADHASSWSLSDASMVRFTAGIAGVSLGISLVSGAARLIHDTISGIIDRQIDWERSLVTVRGIYGDIGSHAVQIAQAQAATPGLLGSQSEFLQANVAASYLTRRYGVPQEQVTGLTSAGGAASFALGLNEQQRRDLQARLLGFAESGGSGLRDIGVEGDDLSLARALGGTSGAQLQALTPQQIRQAQTLIATAGAARFALQGSDNSQGLLAQVRNAEATQARVSGAVTGVVEAGLFGNQQYGVSELGEYYNRSTGAAASPEQALGTNLDELQKAVQANTDQLKDAADQLSKMGVSVESTTFKLLGFAGSLEDVNSIARSDIAAQAQGAVAARARMATPSFATTQGDIVASAQNTAYQNAYQNFVARQAQEEQGNAIREELERRVQFGPANQRPAAQMALDEARATEPLQQRLGEANKAASLVDLQQSETQAQLERITLTQRERYVQLMRDTIDLRRLDIDQQRLGISAQMDVIRAQQQALPAQNRASDAAFQSNQARALADARMARVLEGKDVSGFPGIDQLIRMDQQGQLAAAENEPALLAANRGVELAGRTATARGLAEQLTAGQVRNAELGNDLANMGDLQSQLALQVDLIGIQKDQLAINTEQRDILKDIARAMTGRPVSLTSGQNIDEISARVATMVLGDPGGGGGSSNLPLPELPGARRGPF